MSLTSDALTTKPKLLSLIFDMRMDRTIEKDKHYISPGGYEIKTNDNKIYSFDFWAYIGLISLKDNKNIHIEVRELDEESYPNAALITPEMVNNGIFSEFFIYTGEDNEAEIKAKKILSMTFEFIDKDNNIIFVNAPRSLINSANKVLYS